MGRARRGTVVLDVGSAAARLWAAGQPRILELATRVAVPRPAGSAPVDAADEALGASVALVERGVVRHPVLLGRRLRDAARGLGRPARALVSVRVDADDDDVRALTAAVDRLAGDDTVVVPAAVAALATTPAAAALVVDVGAALTEVSWVESGEVGRSHVFAWGVDDLVRGVGRRLHDDHGVAVSVAEVGNGLRCGLAVGRDVAGGGTRVVRVTSALVAACAEPALATLDDAIDDLTADPSAPLVAVGGGLLLPCVRSHLRARYPGRWTATPHPRYATVSGLAALTGDPGDRITQPAILATPG